MAIIKWVERKTKLLRKEYLRLRYDGMSRNRIRLAYFDDDVKLFRDQLIDWELLSLEAEWEELKRMGKVAKEINLTKDDYLQRRLKGESRTKIARSLGIAMTRFYEVLRDWGIRELDAEEFELELLAPANPTKTVNECVADTIEQAAEARENQQWPAEVVAELEQTEAGEDILKRMEQRAAAQEQELANLQAAYELWKNEAERKTAHIAELKIEIARLNDALSGAAVIADQSGARIKELESEQQLLLQTIEQAAGTEANMIKLQIPIMPVHVAVMERTRIYSTLEALSHSIEGAEIDRKRVATELFELLQRVVNFVTADLVELHPGQDATAYIHEFFGFYNKLHLQSIEDILDVQQAG